MTLGDKVKEVTHNIKATVTGHKDEKEAHAAAEHHHKGEAKGGVKAAEEDVKDAAGHAKDHLGAKVDKNKAEGGAKVGKGPEEANNLALKEEKKGEEKAHKGAIGDKLGDAKDNLKGGKDHAKDAAEHNKEKNKHEGQEKVDNARAKASNEEQSNTHERLSVDRASHPVLTGLVASVSYVPAHFRYPKWHCSAACKAVHV
ncbi:hypothetical protein WJX73_009802 [Symbiochloris irregularis]|uniref:Uncharacterized protein n=1 Tax=Symbiochloris irregularis TaxID=706552 RepID=A0AAW1P2U0_9CHLO